MDAERPQDELPPVPETQPDERASQQDLERRLELSEGSPFDLVILDLTIPGGVGGVQVIQALKESHPGVRAVVSSGYSSDPVVAHFDDYGFCGVMAKPYTETDVRVVLNGVLGPAS